MQKENSKGKRKMKNRKPCKRNDRLRDKKLKQIILWCKYQLHADVDADAPSINTRSVPRTVICVLAPAGPLLGVTTILLGIYLVLNMYFCVFSWVETYLLGSIHAGPLFGVRMNGNQRSWINTPWTLIPLDPPASRLFDIPSGPLFVFLRLYFSYLYPRVWFTGVFSRLPT